MVDEDDLILDPDSPRGTVDPSCLPGLSYQNSQNPSNPHNLHNPLTNDQVYDQNQPISAQRHKSSFVSANTVVATATGNRVGNSAKQRDHQIIWGD